MMKTAPLGTSDGFEAQRCCADWVNKLIGKNEINNRPFSLVIIFIIFDTRGSIERLESFIIFVHIRRSYKMHQDSMPFRFFLG